MKASGRIEISSTSVDHPRCSQGEGRVSFGCLALWSVPFFLII